MNVLPDDFMDRANANVAWLRSRSSIHCQQTNELNTTTSFLYYDDPRSCSQGKTLDCYALSQKHHRKV